MRKLRDLFDFNGRRAIVTGAGSGIGAATARLLLDAGAHVLAADVAERGLAELESSEVERVACDVTSAVDRSRLLDRASPCDYLVNAAGVIRLAPLAEVDDEHWEAVMGVNAKALFFLCQSFEHVMRDGGAIVNVSSLAARWGRTTEIAVYGASKAAVLAITRSFAHAYASRNVRVNALVPGIVDTPMQRTVVTEASRIRATTPERLHKQRLGNVPLNRAASPDECAQAILFLLSPACSYTTGQSLYVDGGWMMT